MTTALVRSISEEELEELEERCEEMRQEGGAVMMGEEYLRGLITRLRAAERELSVWRPIMDEVDRRADKQWCLQDKCDFTVTVFYDDYAAIDAMSREPNQ